MQNCLVLAIIEMTQKHSFTCMWNWITLHLTDCHVHTGALCIPSNLGDTARLTRNSTRNSVPLIATEEFVFQVLDSFELCMKMEYH